MQKITPFLWFDSQAEEAANHYVSIFNNSSISAVTRYDAGSAAAAGRPAGSVMTVAFRLDGQEFVALNGGPVFRINEAVSFVVNCADQAEIDRIWARLTDGGEEVQCGWLKDRFGVSWQVLPTALPQLLGGDPEAAGRAWHAMLQMKKIDIAALQRARDAA